MAPRRKRKKRVKRRSAAARALASPLYRPRVVKPKKGRGSYVRKDDPAP